jgi:hypothetical protein
MRGFRPCLITAFLLWLPVAILGQAEPASSLTNTMPSNNFGFNLPSKIGTLSYSLTGSEQIQTGYGGGGVYAGTTFSGNLAYLSKSENSPFSLVYTGGLTFGDLPDTSDVQFYQNIAASQVFRTRSWVFVASDSFSYLPGSPTTGLSGVAGVGDVGIPPVQTGSGPDQTILTENSSRFSNGLDGSATWQTTASLDFEGSVNWQVLKFVGDNPGYDTSSFGGTVGPNYRIDARNSIGANAYYSQSTFPNFKDYLIQTEGITVNYTRAWSRRLSTTVGFGPARTTGNTTSAIPSQINLSGLATLSYATRTTGLFASYDRSVGGGSGVILGAITDSVTVGMNRPVARDWTVGLNAGYSHNVGLTPLAGGIPTYDSVFGGAQVSRRLTNTLSMYGSYTAISQSENQAAQQSAAFNGLNNIISIGITFAPAPLISGR